MLTEETAAQRKIVDWFDAIYRRKGTRYLRPREAYLVFMELLKTRPGEKLLDVACGLGLLLDVAAEYTTELHGIDISQVAVTEARKRAPRARILVANAERLPYGSATFDVVTCLGSLERMLHVSRVLYELHRVGRERARYCFLVRNSNTLTWQWFAGLRARERASAHAGADTLDNWRRLFESHGFAVTSTLPDQYPLHRMRNLTSPLLGPVDFRAPLQGSGRIDRANEFVFVLEKVS